MMTGRPDFPHDPYYVIIAGVGGQGNLMASRLLGDVMLKRGLRVTIGETFGVSQRGGSVMSHLSISRDSARSPQIPRGRAHLVMGLEPSETIRVLADYGNPEVLVVCNTHPLYPIAVISGQADYPSPGKVRESVSGLAARAWFLDATAEAMKLGSPIFGNVVMVGAGAGAGALPVSRDEIEASLAGTLVPDRVAANLVAFDAGHASVEAR